VSYLFYYSIPRAVQVVYVSFIIISHSDIAPYLRLTVQLAQTVIFLICIQELPGLNFGCDASCFE
jgi:hypothetical protein